ncbi:MAG TPA: MFS transporter [Candidatus Binatia bacterium]|nr:MFS transporter [Candidatus Binatia bacterium]
MAGGSAGLWRHRDFVKLWAGETISVFGSLVTATALPFTAVLLLHATPMQMSLLRAADIAPQLLVGVAAGVWVDRLPRRLVLIATDLGRALLLATIPAAVFFGVLRIEQLYAVGFLAGLLSMVFAVAFRAYLPSLVRREDLVEGNSKLSASAAVAEVGAFSLTGWLVQVLTGPIAILIDACSYVVSAAFVSTIRAREPPIPPAAHRRMLRESAEGLRFVVGHPVLRTLAVSTMLLQFAFYVFSTVFMLFVTTELGFAPGVLGMIFAVGGVSSLVGASAAQRATQRFGVGSTMITGLLCTGLGILLVPLAPGATALGAALLIAQQLVEDGAATIYDLTEVSVRQSLAPSRMLGRVNASLRMASLAAMLLGSLVGGVLGETIGLRATLVVAALSPLVAAVWLAGSPVRSLRSVAAGES